ncbi:hypothetical protein Ddc_13310 [Ditylenchus destructor]|nr:hypothetical protein Ddc_13310 [Ditylenchus destructor]
MWGSDQVNAGSGHFWIEKQIAKGLTELNHQISGESVYLYATLDPKNPETEDPIEMKYNTDWTYELTDYVKQGTFGGIAKIKFRGDPKSVSVVVHDKVIKGSLLTSTKYRITSN